MDASGIPSGALSATAFAVEGAGSSHFVAGYFLEALRARSMSRLATTARYFVPFAFSFFKRLRSRMTSITPGRIEMTMIPRMTAEKFFFTNSTLAKR